MTTVTLKFKEDNGGEVTVKKVQKEIERIKLYQFTSTIKIVKDILVILNDQGGLKELLETAFSSEMVNDMKLQEEGIDEGKVEEMMKNLDNKFIVSAVEAFKELAVNVPDKFIELVSVLSEIKREDLDKQDLIDVFDIVDAVFEVNDIEALINRIKKSLGATVGKFKFLQMRRNVTA
jgi:hypothetical protein